MRSKQLGLTPRESALLIGAQWIRAAHEGLTADLLEVDDRDSYRVQVRSALAKEHNKLVARIGSMEVERIDPDDMELPEMIEEGQ